MQILTTGPHCKFVICYKSDSNGIAEARSAEAMPLLSRFKTDNKFIVTDLHTHRPSILVYKPANNVTYIAVRVFKIIAISTMDKRL